MRQNVTKCEDGLTDTTTIGIIFLHDICLMRDFSMKSENWL